MASTGTVQELEKQMDEYQYALSVEWDQKDQAFYDTATKAFFQKMETLIKNGGLTQDQVMKVVESKSISNDTIEAIKLKLSLLDKNASTEDLVNLVKDSSKDLYSRGASWNGEVIYMYSVWAVVIGVIAYSVWWSNTHECVATENQYVCDNYSNCMYTGGAIGGYSYDTWGNWVQAGYTCYGPATSYCGYQDVCTQYAKK